MVDAYNFLASWQLFPEKGTYEFGSRPKSGIYKIELSGTGKELTISMNWVSLEDQAFASQFTITPDGAWNEFQDIALGDTVRAGFSSQLGFEVEFTKDSKPALLVQHEITPKGYLRVVRQHINETGENLPTKKFITSS
jgi:hypothetical protein